MTVKTLPCIAVDCDVCDERFADDEGVYHLTTVAEFIELNADWDPDYRWLIQPDGYAVCPDDDQSHASVRESLKKHEPQPEIPGQLSVAEEGAHDGR